MPRATKSTDGSKTKSAASEAKPATPAPAPVAAKATKRTSAATKGAAASTAKTTKAPARKGGDAADRPVPADKFLAQQQELLLAERVTYTEQASALKEEADLLARDAEPGDVQFDEESGEGATAAIDRERNLALSAQARAAVEEIDRALAKIDAGTYGNCERCGEPIPQPRLEALPQASLCVSCKSGGLSRR